jgi:hypothetical protein
LFLPNALYRVPVSEIATHALYTKCSGRVQGVLVVFIAMLLYSCTIRCLGTPKVALLIAFVPILSALAAVPLLARHIRDHLFGVGPVL